MLQKSKAEGSFRSDEDGSKEWRTESGKFVYKASLVNIDITAPSEFFKILNADWQKSFFHTNIIAQFAKLRYLHESLTYSPAVCDKLIQVFVLGNQLSSLCKAIKKRQKLHFITQIMHLVWNEFFFMEKWHKMVSSILWHATLQQRQLSRRDFPLHAQAERKFGYYVLPILYGENFIGRIEPVFDRKAKKLEVKNLWYEQGIEETKEIKESIEETLNRIKAI